MLTADELAALAHLDGFMQAFRRLPVCHESEIEEAVLHVHGLQTLVMARSAVRAHPDVFRAAPAFHVPPPQPTTEEVSS